MYLLSAMDRASDWGMKMNTEYQVGLLVISCLFGLFLERWYLSRRHTSNADAPRVRSSVAQALLTVVNTNQNVRIIWNPSASEVAVISRNPVGEGCLSEMRIPDISVDEILLVVKGVSKSKFVLEVGTWPHPVLG